MIFEITHDYELVRSILTDPRSWRRMVNDSAPPPDAFAVGRYPNIQYVLAKRASDVVGLFLIDVTKTPGVAEIHFCFRPGWWGRCSTEFVARAFLEWVWRETSLRRLRGPLPSYNRLALRLARAVGFQDSEIHVGAVKKGGKEYDLIVLELARPAKRVQVAETG